MIKNIGGLNAQQLGANQAKNTKAETAKAGSAAKADSAAAAVNTGASSKAADKVSISSQAKVLSDLESKLSKLPDVDMERVDKLKQAISDGSYQINEQSIADKMLNSDRDFV